MYPISPGELHAYNVRGLLNGDKPVDDFEKEERGTRLLLSVKTSS